MGFLPAFFLSHMDLKSSFQKLESGEDNLFLAASPEKERPFGSWPNKNSACGHMAYN